MKKWGLLGEENETCLYVAKSKACPTYLDVQKAHTCFEKDLIQANQKAIDIAY